MNYAVHIHPCRTARERDTAVRISQRVHQARAHDADDLVDDILFILDKSGLEEARLSAADDVRQVRIEGRLWLSWFPAAVERAARPPQEDLDRPFSIPEAAMRFGYNEKTLRIYVSKGWLRADTNAAGHPVITESAMRLFKDSLCTGINARTKHLAKARYSARGFVSLHSKRPQPLLPRCTRRERNAERHSCMVARRSGGRARRSVIPSGHSRDAAAFPLRPVRSGYVLRELVPLPFRRAQVLSRDSATLPLVSGAGPPTLNALMRAGP